MFINLPAYTRIKLTKMASVCLNLYPTVKGYIGKISYDGNENKIKNNDNVVTIVILDRSGSMESNVERLVNGLLPDTFAKLGYKETDKITLILFDDYIKVFDEELQFYRTANIKTRGGRTFMAEAVRHMYLHVVNNCKGKKIRLLTVSDGELHDQYETLTAATNCSEILKDTNIVNSQAVRLFTSLQQPDTRGLASVLQINNINKASLIDINCNNSNDNIITQFVKLFENDGLDTNTVLTSSNKILLHAPWGNPTDKIHIAVGDNIFWMTEKPSDLIINGKQINVTVCDSLSFDNYGEVLKNKIDYYLNQIKVLKVVNTGSSINEIKNIVNYFSELEKYMELSDMKMKGNLDGTGLKSRIEYFKNKIFKQTKSVSMQMSKLQNDALVGQFNSAQQADYLRSIDNSKNSKGLAKRAVTNGLDFDSNVRNEVKNMSDHIHELADIDDSEHIVSFYSQDTTLGGIKAVCELVNEGIIESMGANDILQLINIVGVPCDAEIGEFVDPMTWRVRKIFTGCFVSLSDVLAAYVTSDGKTLKTIYGNNDIVNVIPIFEDDKVHQFMRKHAPLILEYTCSIGMRRVISDIPMTYGYTVCAAVWRMIEELNDSKTDVNIDIFVKFVKTFKVAVGGYFDHIMQYLVDQDNKMSYYIANNGVTNMINPLIKLSSTGDTNNMTRIMRALYSYEVVQIVKRKFKKNDNADLLMIADLNKLIGIDLDKYKTNTKPLFEDEGTPDFHDLHHENTLLLDEYIKSLWYIDYLTLLPEFLGAVFKDNPSEHIKKIQKMDNDSIKKSLGIDYDLRTFQMYNIMQALLYNTKAKRVDKEACKMKIIDLGNKDNADNMASEYIKKQYIDKYQSDVSIKSKNEKEKLSEILVDSLIKDNTIGRFITLMKDGITKAKTTAHITNSSSLGFIGLKNKLLNLDNDVPLRLEKLEIILLGRDDKNNIVWNLGNTLRTKLQQFKDVFTTVSDPEIWNILLDKYKTRDMHVYREDENRHGHSNEKPSYFVWKYKSTDDLAQNVTAEELAEYKSIHKYCCFPFAVVNKRKADKEAKKQQSQELAY
jgi:hypothetical protein